MTKVIARRCDGLDIEKVKRLQQEFRANAAQLSEGKPDLAMACGYVIGYPVFLGNIGDNWHADNIRISAYYDLNHVHQQALHVLIAEAERLGLDGGALWEYGRVCREVFASEPWRYRIGDADSWPACLGESRTSLSQEFRDAIRAGETLVVRLNARGNIEADTKPNVGDVGKGTMLTSKEAADRLGMNAQALTRIINKPGGGGLIGDKTPDGCWLIDEASITAYAAAHPKKDSAQSPRTRKPLPRSRQWECSSCGNDDEWSITEPTHCKKCARARKFNPMH